jgi:hypothetical protein
MSEFFLGGTQRLTPEQHLAIAAAIRRMAGMPGAPSTGRAVWVTSTSWISDDTSTCNIKLREVTVANSVLPYYANEISLHHRLDDDNAHDA